MQASMDLFASPEVVDLTKIFLQAEVCNEFEDIAGCQNGVEEWYEPMVEAGLDAPDFGSRFCYHYGLCVPERKPKVCF